MEEAIKSFERQVMDFVVSDSDDAEGPMELFMASGSIEHSEEWSSPSQRWFKINSDVVVSNGGSILAFIVRDYRGDVIEMTSKLSGHKYAFEVELVALIWAAKFAADKN